MAVTMALGENETLLKEVKADYWDGPLSICQNRGIYLFTNQRILFFMGYFGDQQTPHLDLPYKEISAARLCNVGSLIKIMPTGILVTMKNGKKHCLSVMKRKELLELIQSKL